MEINKKWKRNCSICNEILEYAFKKSWVYAKRKKSVCRSCSKSGKNNSMSGKSVYDIWVEKYGKNEADRKKRNMNEKKTGENNPGYRPDVRRKKRLAMIKRIQERSGQVYPGYNPSAISIIETKAIELGITDLQHAENGGEFHIEKLGYFVDGYSLSKNVVIEYYELYHKNQTEHDIRRKQEIIDELECEFIEIKEWKGVLNE